MTRRRAGFYAQVTLSWFYVGSSIKVCFCGAMITASVKPCTEIILNIIFKHALLPSAFDLDFALTWLCYDFTSSLAFNCVVWSCDSCECHTLHSNCPRHTLQSPSLTQCPWPRVVRVTLSWFYVESSIIVYLYEEVIAASVKSCTVIVIDVVFKHAPRLGVLDLDFSLKWLCHDFTSSLAFKCFSV